MDERVSVPMPAELVMWLKAEAERRQRSVAFIVREAVERDRARREAQSEAA